MTSRKSFAATAVAALSGLALTVTAASAIAAGRGISPPPVDNQKPADNANGLEIALALETTDDNNTFGAPSLITAPDANRFALRGELSKSAGEGLCNDVDFYHIDGLTPLGEYIVGLVGPSEMDGHVGLFDDTGLLTDTIDPGLAGKILATANGDGGLNLAVSALLDGDFDGNEDKFLNPHGLCAEYLVHFEQVVFGDLNADAQVDTGDVRVLLGAIGSTTAPAADLTNDGIVDADDLRVLANTVTDRKARKLASKNAKKLAKRQAKAAKKAQKLAEKTARKAAREAKRLAKRLASRGR